MFPFPVFVCYPDKTSSLLPIPDRHRRFWFFSLLFFQLGFLSLEHFCKNIGKSHISNIKQQLIGRMELYRSMGKDERKGAREVFSTRQKSSSLDVTKNKQEMCTKFLPQESNFPKC